MALKKTMTNIQCTLIYVEKDGRGGKETGSEHEEVKYALIIGI